MRPPPRLLVVLRRRGLAVAAVLLALAASGCDIPRDPDGTLGRVRGGTLRVGVSENPPFVIREGEATEPRGVEADLVRAFAADLGATLEWHWGAMHDHVAALEQNELDLAAGGLPAASPLAMRVGASQPYYRGHEAIGAPPEASGASWDGARVAVPAARAIASRVEAEGAVPVRVDHPEAAGGFAAAPDWQLRAWGMRPVHRLGPAEYVLAVPPGENGMLHRLDLFLAGRQDWAARALVRDAAARRR